MDENARSLRPGICSVNPLQDFAGGMSRFFREGSGMGFCGVFETAFPVGASSLAKVCHSPLAIWVDISIAAVTAAYG
jgi:hypothetical protein